MATVYRARRSRDQGIVALKVLHEHLAYDRSYAERFRREAEAAGKIAHPAVVPIFGVGQANGRAYLEMEYVEGSTLADYLKAAGSMPVELALPLVAAIASGLQVAHRAGIVHRDLKPSNIMMVAGAPRIMDFGIAKLEDARTLTATGMFAGTPAYMAPEQVEGTVATAQSDLYALGIILFELLTGDAPFRSDTPMGVLQEHLKTAPPPILAGGSRVPSEIEAIVDKLLRKDPADRYQSGDDLAQAIEDVLAREARDESAKDDEPQPATSPATADASKPVTAPTDEWDQALGPSANARDSARPSRWILYDTSGPVPRFRRDTSRRGLMTAAAALLAGAAGAGLGYAAAYYLRPGPRVERVEAPVNVVVTATPTIPVAPRIEQTSSVPLVLPEAQTPSPEPTVPAERNPASAQLPTPTRSPTLRPTRTPTPTRSPTPSYSSVTGVRAQNEDPNRGRWVHAFGPARFFERRFTLRFDARFEDGYGGLLVNFGLPAGTEPAQYGWTIGSQRIEFQSISCGTDDCTSYMYNYWDFGYPVATSPSWSHFEMEYEPSGASLLMMTMGDVGPIWVSPVPEVLRANRVSLHFGVMSFVGYTAFDLPQSARFRNIEIWPRVS